MVFLPIMADRSISESSTGAEVSPGSQALPGTSNTRAARATTRSSSTRPRSVSLAPTAAANRESRARQKTSGKHSCKSTRGIRGQETPPALALENLSPASPPSLQVTQGWSPDVVSQGLLAGEVGLSPVSPSGLSGVGPLLDNEPEQSVPLLSLNLTTGAPPCGKSGPGSA